MIIPVVISFIASLIILNVAVLPINQNFNINEDTSEKVAINYILKDKGSVLGVQEVNAEEQAENKNRLPDFEEEEVDREKVIVLDKANNMKIFVETPKEIGNTVIRVVDNLKKIAKESLKPLRRDNRLPVNGDKDIELLSEPYKLEARSGTVYDVKNNTFVFKKEANNHLPIASITKLMTALVFLDNNPGFDQIYKIRKEDRREGGKIYVYQGEQIKVKDLFYLSLVGSANSATISLVHSTGMTEEEFIKEMNLKAKNLGLYQTNFKDPVGLNTGSYSTAKDIALLAKEALSHIEIREATKSPSHSFKTEEGRAKTIYTTDDLLINFPTNGVKLLGGKTGYTDAAGYCFVGGFINKDGRELISVVLGAKTSNERFSETKNLINWTFENIDK